MNNGGTLGLRFRESRKKKKKEACFKFIVSWNDANGFEVNKISNTNNMFIVNVQRSRYTRRKWNLTNIPCCYVIFVIMNKN